MIHAFHIAYTVAHDEAANMYAIQTKSLIVAKVFGQLLCVYGLLGWIYGVLIQLTNPCWLTIAISHIIPWLRLDTFTILSFIGSGFGFVIWKLAKELIDANRKTTA